jgi:hypothetical protein
VKGSTLYIVLNGITLGFIVGAGGGDGNDGKPAVVDICYGR